jgi:hypothetical protein
MSDSRPNFQNTASYFGQPYFWGMLESFGGRPGMYGVMNSVATSVASARTAVVGLGKETHALPDPPPPRYLRLMCENCTVAGTFARRSPVAAASEGACKVSYRARSGRVLVSNP